ncbi:MAG: hypothetical protein RDV48_15520 [Candidatus Eremiobacteraeota bacterium]|nr:hypothetical protein [Candidatus Eremiobacteraeota bacterium]
MMKKYSIVIWTVLITLMLCCPLFLVVHGRLSQEKALSGSSSFYELEAREKQAAFPGGETSRHEGGGPGGPGGEEPCGMQGPGGPGGPGGHGGPGGMQGPGERPPMAPPTLSNEDLERAEKFVKENDEVKYKDLQQMKAKDEMIYKRIMADIFRDMLFMEKLKKDKPELYKTLIEERRQESQCHEIIKKFKEEKDGAKQKALREELRKTLGTLFELRQKAKDERVKDIEKSLAELKKKSEERKKNKDKIVNLRLEEMLGRAQDLEW